MKETIDLLGKILTNILTALYEPFGFSILLSFLAMFFYLYAYEPIHAGKGWKSAIVTWYQKFKESVFFRKLFFLAFVTSLILFRTLLNRQLWMNPLSDVMGGWGIWETVNGERTLTTECIENVIMMVPFSAVVMWTFEEKIGNGWKKILWYSGKIAFGFSVSIEMLQLLLRLGTFQLSDIFYNTEKINAIFGSSFLRTLKSVGEDSLNCGLGWMFIHYDDNGALAFKRIKPHELIPIWRDAEHTILEMAIRVYPVLHYQNKQEKIIYKVEVFDKTGISYFEYNDDFRSAEPYHADFFTVVLNRQRI